MSINIEEVDGNLQEVKNWADSRLVSDKQDEPSYIVFGVSAGLSNKSKSLSISPDYLKGIDGFQIPWNYRGWSEDSPHPAYRAYDIGIGDLNKDGIEDLIKEPCLIGASPKRSKWSERGRAGFFPWKPPNDENYIETVFKIVGYMRNSLSRHGFDIIRIKANPQTAENLIDETLGFSPPGSLVVAQSREYPEEISLITSFGRIKVANFKKGGRRGNLNAFLHHIEYGLGLDEIAQRRLLSDNNTMSYIPSVTEIYHSLDLMLPLRDLAILYPPDTSPYAMENFNQAGAYFHADFLNAVRIHANKFLSHFQHFLDEDSCVSTIKQKLKRDNLPYRYSKQKGFTIPNPKSWGAHMERIRTLGEIVCDVTQAEFDEEPKWLAEYLANVGDEIDTDLLNEWKSKNTRQLPKIDVNGFILIHKRESFEAIQNRLNNCGIPYQHFSELDRPSCPDGLRILNSTSSSAVFMLTLKEYLLIVLVTGIILYLFRNQINRLGQYLQDRIWPAPPPLPMLPPPPPPLPPNAPPAPMLHQFQAAEADAAAAAVIDAKSQSKTDENSGNMCRQSRYFCTKDRLNFRG